MAGNPRTQWSFLAGKITYFYLFLWSMASSQPCFMKPEGIPLDIHHYTYIWYMCIIVYYIYIYIHYYISYIYIYIHINPMLSDDEGPKETGRSGSHVSRLWRYPIVLHPYHWIHLSKKNVQNAHGRWLSMNFFEAIIKPWSHNQAISNKLEPYHWIFHYHGL